MSKDGKEQTRKSLFGRLSIASKPKEATPAIKEWDRKAIDQAAQESEEQEKVFYTTPENRDAQFKEMRRKWAKYLQSLQGKSLEALEQQADDVVKTKYWKQWFRQGFSQAVLFESQKKSEEQENPFFHRIARSHAVWNIQGANKDDDIDDTFYSDKRSIETFIRTLMVREVGDLTKTRSVNFLQIHELITIANAIDISLSKAGHKKDRIGDQLQKIILASAGSPKNLYDPNLYLAASKLIEESAKKEKAANPAAAKILNKIASQIETLSLQLAELNQDPIIQYLATHEKWKEDFKAGKKYDEPKKPQTERETLMTYTLEKIKPEKDRTPGFLPTQHQTKSVGFTRGRFMELTAVAPQYNNFQPIQAFVDLAIKEHAVDKKDNPMIRKVVEYCEKLVPNPLILATTPKKATQTREEENQAFYDSGVRKFLYTLLGVDEDPRKPIIIYNNELAQELQQAVIDHLDELAKQPTLDPAPEFYKSKLGDRLDALKKARVKARAEGVDPDKKDRKERVVVTLSTTPTVSRDEEETEATLPPELAELSPPEPDEPLPPEPGEPLSPEPGEPLPPEPAEPLPPEPGKGLASDSRMEGESTPSPQTKGGSAISLDGRTNTQDQTR